MSYAIITITHENGANQVKHWIPQGSIKDFVDYVRDWAQDKYGRGAVLRTEITISSTDPQQSVNGIQFLDAVEAMEIHRITPVEKTGWLRNWTELEKVKLCTVFVIKLANEEATLVQSTKKIKHLHTTYKSIEPVIAELAQHKYQLRPTNSHASEEIKALREAQHQ